MSSNWAKPQLASYKTDIPSVLEENLDFSEMPEGTQPGFLSHFHSILVILSSTKSLPVISFP